MNYEKIKKIGIERSLSVKEIAHKIDMTEQGLYKMIRNESMKVEVLEKIADVLEVPVTVFFDDNENYNTTLSNNKVIQNGNGNKIQVSQQANELEKLKLKLQAAKKEIEGLKAQLYEKTERINELKDTINILKNR